MAIFSDDAFKDIFEQKGAAATADAPELPQYKGPGDLPQLPVPGPEKPPKKAAVPAHPATMSDEAFTDIFQKKGPAAEGLTGQRQGYDPASFDFQPKLGQDNELLRAQQQGWVKQLGKTVGNTVANVPLDILQAVAQTGELLTSDHSYDNFGESAIEKIKNPFGEVYREHPDKTFDLADPAWWFNNAGGFAEGTAQFLIPGEAEAAGIGSAVKGLSEAFKLGKGVTQALMGVGQGLSATHLAYLMAASSGRQVYKDSYDTNYHRLLNQGLDPYTADEQARQISSEAAATTVHLSTALNTVFGLAALTPMFRTGDNKVMSWLATDGARQEGESLTAWKERLQTAGVNDEQLQAALKERPGGIMSGYPAQALQIGIQGINTEYGEKTGREQAAGTAKGNVDAIADYFDKVTDQQGALNFLTGLIGGPVHALLMDNIPMHKVVSYDDSGKPIVKQSAAGETMTGKDGNPQYVTQRVSARTRNELGNQVFFNSMKDAIGKDVDWYSGKQTELQDAVRKGDNLKAEMVRQEMFNVLNLHAVSMGMGDNWKKEYQGISALDNTKDLGEQLQPQIDDLNKQIEAAQQQGQDPAPLQQQLQVLTVQQQKLSGKIEASIAGFSRGIGDNDYKDKAARASDNLDWLKKSYDNTRRKYVTTGNPDSEDLAYHVFAREAELHLMQQTLDDEKTSIARDQSIADPIHTYNEQAKVSDAAAQSLNADRQKMQELLEKNDMPGLRELAGKYRVPSYGDHLMVRGVQETIERMQEEIDRHNADSKTAIEALHNETGYTKWTEKNAGKGFDDFLQHLSTTQPVDDRIAERKARVADMESQLAIRRDNLDKVRSGRGIEEFYKRARKDMEQWKKGTEEKNARDNTTAFLRQQDMVAAERLRRQSMLGEQGELHQQMLKGIGRENELKSHINNLREKLGALKATEGEKLLAHRAQLRRAELELHQLQQARETNNDKLAEITGAIQDSHRKEETAASLTRDQVQNQTDPKVNAPDQTEPSVSAPPAAPAPPMAAGQTNPTGEKGAVESYLTLKDQLAGTGMLHRAVSNLELLQDPSGYSFDLARAALQPFVEDGTINEEVAHEITLSQKAYLESNQGEIEHFDAMMRGEPLVDTPLPEEIPAPVAGLTPDDVTGPGEPVTPVVNMSPTHVAQPQEAQRIDGHLGAKAMDSMKINTASIQYMEVVKIAKDGRKYHVFLPLYDKLDDHFNPNILKPGFISEGDSIRFEVDTKWEGGINYDHALEVNDYGGSMKRRDSFSNYTEAGKIRMQGEGYTYENVPIRIVHEKSGELVGYLPRTDWVTASFAEGSYRNMVDNYTDAQGNEITGNVEAQKEKLLTVRRLISLAHNDEREEPVRSAISPRDSGGHPFYSTEVNRNTETSKLKPRLGKNLLPDPSLRFGIMNGGTVYTAHNTPLEGPKNFTPQDLSLLGKGKEANNVPMVILPMPNGKSSVSPMYTRQLSERPADIHTIARAIEAHLGLQDWEHNPQHVKWREAIKRATGADGSGKPLDITSPRDLESFINQYYTYTQHFRESDTAMDAKAAPGQERAPRFMLDIEKDGIGTAPPRIKIGTSWSGEKPITASLTPEGKLDPRFEEALTDGLSTHYKNVVFSRGDIRGVNDDKPFHSITIQRNGVARVEKHDNYNEYLKSFAETYVYGKHQAGDGIYLYGANPVTNFSYDHILSAGIPGGDNEEVRATDVLSHTDTDLFDSLINGAPNPGDPKLNTNADPKPPVVKTLEDVLVPDVKTRGLTIPSITEAVGKLYDEASANPDQQFHLDLPGDPKAKIKLGDKSAITMTQLAGIVDSRPIPYNIRLSDDFMSILQNTPRRFLNNLLYEDHSLYEPLPYDEKILGKQIAEMFVPVRDENRQTGVFEAEKQTEVTDNIVQAIKVLMDSGKTRGLSVQGYKDRVKNDVFRMMRDKYRQIADGKTIRGMEAVTREQASNLAREYDKVLRSFDTEGLNFWSLALDKLKGLGINTREDFGRDDNREQMHLTADGTDPLTEATFNESAGHGLRDWSDVSFETDPKDTATARMKMFLATIPDSRVGDEALPREVNLSFTDPKVRSRIVQGTKTLTTRTPEQAEQMGLKLGQDVTTKVEGRLMRVTPLKVMDHSDAVVHEGIGTEEGTTPQPGDMLLKMEPYSPKTNVLSNNKNYLGLSKLADYEELFEKTLATLANQPRDFDHYLQLLRDAGNQYNPNLRALAERLDRADTQTKNEFVSVVSLQYQPFSMVLLDSRRDSSGKSYNVLRTINANRGSQVGTLVETWQQNQKFSPILRRNEAGLTIVDHEKAAELKADLSRVNQLFSAGRPEAQKAAIALMKKVFDYNGITMPDKAIDALVNKTQQWTKRTSLSGEFRRQFSIAEDGRPLGIISTLIQKLAGQTSANDDEDAMEDKSFQVSNPLYTEKNTINILARVAAAYSGQLYSNTHRSSEGKSIYDYGFNNSLSRGVQRIKAEPAFRDKFKDVDIARKSWLLDRLNNDPALRDRFQISYLDGLKVAYMPSASGVVRPAMSDREQLLTSLGLFINGGDTQYAHYLSLTHSDKSTTPVFNNAPRLRDTTVSRITTDKISGEPKVSLSLSDEAIARLHDVFHSEYDRITKAAQVGDYNNPKYEQGAKSFYFLPQFNYDRMKAAAAEGRVPQKVFEKIWIAGKEQLNVKEAPGFKEAVQYLLTRHVDDMTTNTLHEWKKNGIVEDGNTPFDRKYMNRLLTGVGIRYNRESKLYSDRAGQQYDEPSMHNLTAQLAARDYAVNHYLMNVSASQLFYGDPAQVWKGSVDKTMVEYGKRLAKDIAPGRELAFKPGETYTSITAKDFKTNAPYLAEVESLKKAYADGRPLESTDAQELTTVKEHLDVLRAAGRISDGDYKAMTGIITNAKGGYYEFTDPHHQQVILQPQKPVYVGDRTPVQGALLNDYIKSSSYPLYPPFLAGKELDHVRTAMETGNVARLNFESAHKIGVPTTPVDLFDAKGQVRDGVFDSASWKTSARQDLSRDGFRIQQEIPYDEDKDSIRTVSQMNKLITGGIALIDKPFSFEGRQVSAREIISTKESIRKDLFDLNRQELLPKIGAEMRDGKMVVTDRNKLFDTLRQRALDGSLGFTANDVAYLQEANRLPNSDELVIPLMYAPSASKFESMLMSMVGDIANIRMPGHSYIQASPAGQQSVKDWESLPQHQKDQIVRVGGYKGEALKTVRPGEKAGDPLQPAELIAPWRFKGKLENFLIEGPDGRKVLDTSRLPPELLESVTARIPNQGHNSMLPVRIVGFTPPNMGDLVIVPAAITKQMGSDFDVDKLYAYMRAYHNKVQILSDSRKPEHDNIKVDDRFQTMKMGKWEGKQENAEAVREIDKDILAGDKVIGDTGETFHNFEDRVLPAFHKILDSAPANSVVMTHSSVLKLMQQWNEQGRPENYRIDADAYNERETQNGDVIPFKGANGTIWVVRHGQTEDNLANNFRSGDTNLTPEGIRQARESGQYLKQQTGGDIPELHTSHLPRTIHSSNLLMDEVRGNTNVSGPILERSITDEDVLKNRYFDLHWSVLTHPDMLKSILNPLDKDDLKQEAALISKWENKRATIKPTYYDPIYQLRDFQSQKDAKRLVALASLSVTFNATIQDKHIRPGRMGLGADFQPLEEPLPVHLRDENGNIRKLSALSGYGQSGYTDGVGGKGSVQPRSKHDNHTTVQSEVVDYSKNKVSDKVHLSTYTYPASAALTQLQEPDEPSGDAAGKLIGKGRGWAAHLGYNARLLSQPIVQAFVSEMAKRGDSLSGEFNADLKNTIAADIAEQYRAAAEAAGEKELDPSHVVSYDDLTKALESPDTQKNYHHLQNEALNLFMDLDQIGQSMMKAQRTINHDTNGAGSTMLDLLSQEVTRQQVESAIGGKDGDIGLLGAGSLYNHPDGTLTEQGHLYDMMHDGADAVVNREFPYRSLMPVFDYLMQHTNRQDLSIDTQKNVFNSVKSYLFSHPQLGFWADPEVTRANLLYRREGNPSLADRVHEAKASWGEKNYFLQRLQVDIDPDNLHPSHVTYQASKASRLDDYENTKAWLDLFLSPKPEARKLAEDLVRYSYLAGGIQDSRSFVKYIPYSYLVGTDFGHKLRELTGRLDDVVGEGSNFKEQWFQHNPQFARSLTTKMTELGSESEKYPERFSLQPINRENPYVENPAKDLIVRVKQDKGPAVPAYPDYLSYRSKEENRWILYKRMDREGYTRIDTMGDKSMDEYSVGEGLSRRSLIPENRSRAYDNLEAIPRMLNGAPLMEYGERIRQKLDIPTSGGYKEMMDVLRGMTTNPEIPIHARVVADFLSKLPEHGTNTKLVGGVLKDIPAFHFVSKTDIAGFKGQFYAARRFLEINDRGITSPSDLAETINHEMMHAHTSFLSLMSETPEELGRMKYPPAYIARLKAMWEDARQIPGVEDAINDVEEVRSRAEAKLREFTEQKGIDYDKARDAVAGGRMASDLDRLIYSIGNRTEFVANAMTHPGTMRWLNQQSYDGPRSFLSRVGDVVRNLMTALSRVFGRSTQGSLLEAAIGTSLNLAMVGKHSFDLTPERMHDVDNMKLVSGAPITTATMAGLDRIIGKLHEQKDELINSLTGRLPAAEVADKRSKIDDIETDIAKLEKELSTDLVAEIGAKHLGWVEQVVKADTPTSSQIMTASRVLEVWTNLVDLLYGDTGAKVDQQFSDLYSNAQALRSNLTMKMKTTLINSSDNIVGMKDFNSDNLKDIDRAQSLVRGLSSAATSKVTQYIGTYMETVARHRDEDITRNVGRMRDLEDRMAVIAGGKKNLPGFYNRFFQDNADHSAWGLVQRFHQDWYDFRKDMRRKREQAIKGADANPTNDAAAASREKQQAWQHYWKTMNEQAVFADTRLLFDPNTGEHKGDDTAARHTSELEYQLGHDTAHELINDAQGKYKQYLEHKQAYFDSLDGEASSGERPQQEADRLKDEFVSRYSPNVFFNNFKSPSSRFRGLNSDYYVRMAPRHDAQGDHFYDKKFEDIQKDPKVKGIYEEINHTLQSLKDALPVHVQSELGHNFMPAIAKSLFADMIDVPGYLKTMGERTVNDLTASAQEELEGDKSYSRIPLRYVTDDRKNLPLSMRSRDIPRVLETFGMMALHYKHFADAKDYIDMGESILKEIDRARSAGAAQMEQNGRFVTVKAGLRNTLDALKYMKDYLMYKKSRQLEGRTETMIYSANPVKQIRITHDVKNLVKEREELQRKFIDGEIDPAEAQEKIAALNAKINDYDGRRLYGSKIGDKLIGINQLKTLSYNPFSGIANLGFGIMSAAIHANGAVDFGWRELGKATKLMGHSLLKWGSIGAKDTATAHKILSIMDRLGIIGDVIDSHYGKVEVRERKPGWQRAINPYNLMRSGDYYMKGLTTVAMMLHDKVKVTEGGVQKEVSLWEATDHEGKWDSKRFGQNKSWSSEDIMEQKDFDKFRNKAIRVNMIIHGNQDKNSPKLANKYILGRLIGQFRMSWLPEGWYSRFEGERFDIQLGRTIKGRYATIKDLGIMGYAAVTLKQLGSIVARIDPYTGTSRLDGKPLSDVDISNMRRNFAELGWIAGMAGTIMLLKSAIDPGEDDKVRWSLRMLANQLIRNQQDLEYYSSPSVIDSLTKSIIPASDVLKDYWKALKATARVMTDDSYEADKWLLSITHAGIPIPQATLINKVHTAATKDLDTLQ